MVTGWQSPQQSQGGEHHAEDDEDGVDGVDQVRGQLHAEDVPVESADRCHDGELLLVQCPEYEFAIHRGMNAVTGTTHQR